MKFIEVTTVIPLRRSEGNVEARVSINLDHLLTVADTGYHDDTPTSCYIAVGNEKYALYTLESYDEVLALIKSQSGESE